MALQLEHRAQVPQAAGKQRWPAVVMVHGWLGNENVMSIFERTLPPEIVVISPRAPLPIGEASYGWFTLDDPASFAAGLAALETFVRGLPQAYPIDPNRVVLMGFSQGAAMSLALLLKEPALVAAVAGIAGFLPREAQPWVTPGRLPGKWVFIAHGTRDDTVPADWAQEAAEALRLAGAKVDFREHEVGHKLNAQGMRELKEWLGTVRNHWQ